MAIVQYLCCRRVCVCYREVKQDQICMSDLHLQYEPTETPEGSRKELLQLLHSVIYRCTFQNRETTKQRRRCNTQRTTVAFHWVFLHQQSRGPERFTEAYINDRFFLLPWCKPIKCLHQPQGQCRATTTLPLCYIFQMYANEAEVNLTFKASRKKSGDNTGGKTQLHGDTKGNCSVVLLSDSLLCPPLCTHIVET